jgi:hypothetical protein
MLFIFKLVLLKWPKTMFPVLQRPPLNFPVKPPGPVAFLSRKLLKVYGHTTLNAPDLIWKLLKKVGKVETAHYLTNYSATSKTIESLFFFRGQYGNLHFPTKSTSSFRFWNYFLSWVEQCSPFENFHFLFHFQGSSSYSAYLCL